MGWLVCLFPSSSMEWVLVRIVSRRYPVRHTTSSRSAFGLMKSTISTYEHSAACGRSALCRHLFTQGFDYTRWRRSGRSLRVGRKQLHVGSIYSYVFWFLGGLIAFWLIATVFFSDFLTHGNELPTRFPHPSSFCLERFSCPCWLGLSSLFPVALPASLLA